MYVKSSISIDAVEDSRNSGYSGPARPRYWGLTGHLWGATSFGLTKKGYLPLKARIIKIGVHSTLMVLAMLYGMLVMKLHIPPYHFLKAAYSLVAAPGEDIEAQEKDIETKKKAIETKKKKDIETQKKFTETPKEYLDTHVPELISIRRPQDVARLRSKLIALLWGKPRLPSTLPTAIDGNFTDAHYGDISSLSRIDKLSMVMDFGIESHVHHFIPKTPNNKVVLYHQGHDGDFLESKIQIREFLDSGYAVVAFSMPLLGINNQPTVQLPRLGTLKLTTHDNLKFLSPKNGHPVKYLIEPVVIVLNYLKSNFEYSSVSMVGISGGGWTTTLAAAIDTRIQKSFPVAGSYPIYLRSNSARDWGDYEQTVPEIYGTVNYLELYILGSYGPDRKQLQVINQYDACCFAGTKWETYKDIVRERVHELGTGEFALFLDATHRRHFLSEAAMSRILDELSGNHR